MKILFILLIITAFAGNAVASQQLFNFTKDNVNKHISKWPEESKKATEFMINKYGLPSGVTDDMLVWNDVKPFKRSIVYKEPVSHKFPMEHTDVLEHIINYEAPTAEQVGKVWDFDGSIVLERTNGEMSARCDREEANILALNLADEVIRGKRSVEEAKMEYGRQIMAIKEGSPNKLTQKLVFTPSSETAGDPGEPIMDKIKHETMEAQEEKPEK